MRTLLQVASGRTTKVVKANRDRKQRRQARWGRSPGATAGTGFFGRLLAGAGAVAVVVGLMPAISAISNSGVGAASSAGANRTISHIALTDSSLAWAMQFSPPLFDGVSCFDTEDCQVVGSLNGDPTIYATANQG